jgi:hypothetical protein
MPCCGPSRAGGLPYMSADAPASISVGLDGATMEYLVIMSTHVPDGTPDQAVADVRSVRQHARVSSPCRRACCGSRPRCRRGCGRTDEVTPLEPDTDTALAVSGAAGRHLGPITASGAGTYAVIWPGMRVPPGPMVLIESRMPLPSRRGFGDHLRGCLRSQR